MMPCSWEGNRRSGVALAVRHRLQWFIQLQAHDLRMGDEHPTYGTPYCVSWFLPTTVPFLHCQQLKSFILKWLRIVCACTVQLAAKNVDV